MDTSEEYILMCEKSEELQHDELKPGDTFFFDGYKSATHYVKVKELRIFGIDTNEIEDWWKCIWLPRQDQLQEIIKDIEIKTMQVGDSISKKLAMYFGIWVNMKECESLFSWEQYLLAWVMKEKYNKIWKDEEWKTQKNHQ